MAYRKRPLSDREVFRLSSADLQNQVIRIYCHFCRTARRYLPTDLIEVVGDVPVYELTSGMKCDNCGRGEYLAASCESTSGHDIGKLAIRRLVTIRTVRVPIWREDVL